MFGDIRIVEWLIRRIFNQVLAPEFPESTLTSIGLRMKLRTSRNGSARYT